jgi:hypothetical protein
MFCISDRVSVGANEGQRSSIGNGRDRINCTSKLALLYVVVEEVELFWPPDIVTQMSVDIGFGNMDYLER